MAYRCNYPGCGKEFFGARAKQAIRLHIKSAHTKEVTNVDKCEYVEIIDLNEPGKKEEQKPAQKEEKKKDPQEENNWILISEGLKQVTQGGKMWKQLKAAQMDEMMEVNVETHEVR